MAKEMADPAAGDFFVNIPDIIENPDILSALRGLVNTPLTLVVLGAVSVYNVLCAIWAKIG
jgi:hypothetical protein